VISQLSHIAPILFFICFAICSQAQERNADECVTQSMELVSAGKLNEASESFAQCHADFPERLDITISYARSLAWNGKYDQARELLRKVYVVEAENIEALLLESDIAFWESKPKKSIRTINKGLDLDPDNQDFLFRKARLSNDLQRHRTAWENLETLLNINPDHEAAKGLLSRMNKRKPFAAGINFISEQYDKFFSSRFTVNAFVKVPTRRVIYLANVNLTEINSRQGAQIELTAYPSLGKFGYAYLNFGYSKSAFYPRYKIGAELFKDFNSISLSAGLRQNYVNDFTRSTIYTASIAKYVRKLYWSYRVFALPLGDQLALSHVFDARITSKRNNKLHLFIGIGSYTELKPNLFQDELSYWDPRIFQSFGADYSHDFDFVILTAGAIFTRQQFHQVPFPFFRKMTYTLGLEVRF